MRANRLLAAIPTLALLGSLVACSSNYPTTSQRWFADRGRQSPTWYTCLRMGAALREACGANERCASKVTRHLTRSCYAARYDQSWVGATPNREVRAEELSPCFWDNVPDHGTPADYERRTCDTVVEPRLQPFCIAELREVIEGICVEGAMDLTGAGP